MHAYLLSYFKNLKKFTAKDKDNIYLKINLFLTKKSFKSRVFTHKCYKRICGFRNFNLIIFFKVQMWKTGKLQNVTDEMYKIIKTEKTKLVPTGTKPVGVII